MKKVLPKQIGPYRILEELGEGGMAIVYLAQQEQPIRRRVALKVIKLGMNTDEVVARFEAERQALALMNHTNIAKVFDAGITEEGRPYFVMEYVAGISITKYCDKHRLGLRERIELFTQTCQAIHHAHQKGIIHRDIKPSNVLVSHENGKAVPKVIDFGIAKATNQRLTEKTIFTQQGAFIGTPEYMSPEQAEGSGLDVDKTTDVYSLGVLLYELLVGAVPFEMRQLGYSQIERIIREEEPPKLMTRLSALGDDAERIAQRRNTDFRSLRRQLTGELEWITRKAMEKDRTRRYQSAEEFAADVERYLNNEAVMAGPPSVAYQLRKLGARHRGALAAVGLTLAAVVAVLAVLVGLNVGGMREQLLGGASAPKIGSVAVLPLVNLSGDPEQEYFADGMTEALITNLAKIGSLKVISRTSVMRYKGSNKTSPEIAQELGVEALLEGSVMRAGDRVRITVQLFHAATDEQIWAESYERELRDILILQGEVAHEIARQIRLRLTPEEEVRLARARPVNPEAHQTYLRGRYHLNRATAEGFNKAIEHFNEAIEKDPGFALAYAGLAEAYVRQADWQLAAPHEVSPQAEAAAMKALEIDETLAQAHANLGYLRWGYRWDWAAPEKEFQRAIALNPSDSTAHFRYSSYLLWLSRFDEAIAELKRAQELDPLSLVKHADLGVAFYVAGDYDRAIEQLQGTLELDSDSDYAHWWLGVAYLEKARYEEAIAEIRKAIALSGGAPNYMAALGVAYATAGNAEAALKVLEELNALSKRRYVSSYQIARVYAALGEKEQAFRWLEKAHEEHAIWFIWLRLDLAFADLRSDPRFQDLVRRMNLPES